MEQRKHQTSIFSSPKTYIIFLVIYAAFYEIFDSYNTSFYPTIVSWIKSDLGISNSVYYFILSIGSLGLYLVIIFQYFSDIAGRKPILIVAFFGMGLSMYLMSLSHQVLMFTFSLFLLYLFFSSDSWVILISEEAPKEKRAIYSYIILLFGVIGVFIIPFFRNWLLIDGQPASWTNMTYFGWLAMPIALLGLFLKESRAFQESKNKRELAQKWNRKELLAKIKLPFSQKNKIIMISFIIIGFIIGTNYASFQTIEAFFTSELSVSTEEISNIVLVGGLGSLTVFGLTGILADKFGRKKIMTIYSFLLTFGVIALVFSTINEILILVYIFAVISQIGFWGCFTLLKVYCVECFPTEIRGSASGWRSFSFAIGFTIGSLISSGLTVFLNLGTLYILLAIWAVILIPFLVWKFLPETKGKDLVNQDAL